MALALPACLGTAVVEHEVRLEIRDPSGRLGAGPWLVAVLAPTHVYDAGVDWAMSNGGGQAGPGTPLVSRFTTQEGALPGWQPRPEKVEMGLVAPALADGWWRTVLIVFADGRVRGYARLCPWGDLLAEGKAPVVLLRGTARPRGGGWSFDLALDVPPRPAAN
jgi:hypothetical protein